MVNRCDNPGLHSSTKFCYSSLFICHLHWRLTQEVVGHFFFYFRMSLSDMLHFCHVVHHAGFVLQKRMHINIKKSKYTQTHRHIHAVTKRLLYLYKRILQAITLFYPLLCTWRKNIKTNCLHKRVNLTQINNELSWNNTCSKIKYIYIYNPAKYMQIRKEARKNFTGGKD